MDALQIANFLKETGPWAVSTILLVMLALFVRGDIVPSKVVENIVAQTVAQATMEYISSVEKVIKPLLSEARAEIDKAASETCSKSTSEHRDILDALHGRRSSRD